MKKLLALILASIMVMSFVTGCGGTKSDSGAASTGKDSSTQQKTEEKQLRVGVSYGNISSQFDSACSNDIVEAGTARGYDLLLTNAESDTQKQITDVEDLISRSCDVILIQPIDKEAVAPAIDACKKAGVPAIVLHRPVLNRSAPDDFVMSMTSDGVYQGQLCCQWAIDNLEGPFKVVELMGPTAVQEAQDRGSGFDNLAESNGGFEFVAKQNADWDRVLARNAMENIIQATGGDFNLVYTHNEEMAFGAIAAMEQAGINVGTDVKVVTIDASKECIQNILDGKIAMTLNYDPHQGNEIFDQIERWMNGEEYELSYILSQTIIDSSNAAEALEKAY